MSAQILYTDSEIQTDTELILCIEEYEDKTYNQTSIDNRIFIGYSMADKDFYVRGKRQDIRDREYVPYAFRSEYEGVLYNFVSFAVGKNNPLSITLYNYNNKVYKTPDDYNYEFFETHMDPNYAIATYDCKELDKTDFFNYLSILKFTYNWDD